MNKLWLKVLIYFVPDIIYINVNHIGICVKVYIPDIDGYIGPGNHFILISQQEFKQLELFCCQVYLNITSLDFLAVEVHFKVCGLECSTRLKIQVQCPFQQYPDLHLQLSEFERLQDVIISP